MVFVKYLKKSVRVRVRVRVRLQGIGGSNLGTQSVMMGGTGLYRVGTGRRILSFSFCSWSFRGGSDVMASCRIESS